MNWAQAEDAVIVPLQAGFPVGLAGFKVAKGEWEPTVHERRNQFDFVLMSSGGRGLACLDAAKRLLGRKKTSVVFIVPVGESLTSVTTIRSVVRANHGLGLRLLADSQRPPEDDAHIFGRGLDCAFDHHVIMLKLGLGHWQMGPDPHGLSIVAAVSEEPPEKPCHIWLRPEPEVPPERWLFPDFVTLAGPTLPYA